jgi:hypothetical protein
VSRVGGRPHAYGRQQTRRSRGQRQWSRGSLIVEPVGQKGSSWISAPVSV